MQKKICAIHTQPHIGKDDRGMTMVEVLMGFVILALLLGMFSKIIVTASNMYYNSVDLKNAEESLQQSVYAKSMTDALTPETGSLQLLPQDGMPGGTSPVRLSNTKLYKLTTSTDLSGEAAESLDVDIYFMKADHTDSNP